MKNQSRPSMVLLDSKEVLTAKVFRVVNNSYAMSDGSLATRSVVQHPGAVVLLPQESDGSLVLVRQYRHAVDVDLLEFPAGTLEADEASVACARRELAEETGRQANEWYDLGSMFSAPGFCTEKLHMFFARDLSPAQAEPDDDENIEVVSLSVAEVEQAILAGTICDAKTIAIFMKARLKGYI